MPQPSDHLGDALHRVHLVARVLHEKVWTPAHDPRTESPGYKREHERLCIELDTPCYICGIKHSTGGQMETHHWHLEWSLMNAADPNKLVQDVPDVPVHDWGEFCAWVDASPENLLVLCAEHHRFGFTGIHAITYPIWVAQRYVRDDFSLTTAPAA